MGRCVRSWRMMAAVFSASVAIVACKDTSKFRGEEFDPVKPAPEIAGETGTGSPFQLTDHRGQVVVVTFGYAHCPDVCPMTLAKLGKVFRQLGADAERATAVMVTVDPSRDKPDTLARYVAGFDRRFVGVRLVGEARRRTFESYGVTVRPREQQGGVAPPSGSQSYYTLDHTSGYFLVDPSGRLRVRHPLESPADALVADIQRLLAETPPAAGSLAVGKPR